MLKRVNIHLSEANLKQLDEMLKKAKADPKRSWGISDTTRADLIRFALANTYGFVFDNIHVHSTTLEKAFGQPKKKAPKPAKPRARR